MKEEAETHKEILEDRIIIQEEAPASKADTIPAGTFMDWQILILGTKDSKQLLKPINHNQDPTIVHCTYKVVRQDTQHKEGKKVALVANEAVTVVFHPEEEQTEAEVHLEEDQYQQVLVLVNSLLLRKQMYKRRKSILLKRMSYIMQR
jgi:hypothetical protein